MRSSALWSRGGRSLAVLLAAVLALGGPATAVAGHSKKVDPTGILPQVKGALMLGARALKNTSPLSAGVGELSLQKSGSVVSPPNPNLALNTLRVPDDSGNGVALDAVSWSSYAQSNAFWSSAAWSSASWTSASWTSASDQDLAQVDYAAGDGLGME